MARTLADLPIDQWRGLYIRDPQGRQGQICLKPRLERYGLLLVWYTLRASFYTRPRGLYALTLRPGESRTIPIIDDPDGDTMTSTDPAEHRRAADAAFATAAAINTYVDALMTLRNPDSRHLMEELGSSADRYQHYGRGHLRTARQLEQEATE
ncbi:hypothetical protein [Corynebacterium sp. TAE3-ERU16]|uniref:hypothetical protein n=1 Tax=Corynebacterium sp. TAE3-ERU16 TaxID=2849493 RepID=UPI001C48B1CA|nr:hypothetical protein [Corynebacterium sp. TAE3-ERU16]MBV7292345.1 hypothetical protein [Corynebacterium sp. TAE3-ERU16]